MLCCCCYDDLEGGRGKDFELELLAVHCLQNTTTLSLPGIFVGHSAESGVCAPVTAPAGMQDSIQQCRTPLAPTVLCTSARQVTRCRAKPKQGSV